MKRGILVLFIVIFLITATTTVRSIEQIQIVDNEDNDDEDENPFTAIIDLLSQMLVKLNIIAQKETRVNVTIPQPIVNVQPNITVEPAPVNIVTSNDLPKRGFIILAPKREGYTYTGGDYYISLPNGVCDVTVTVHEPKANPVISEFDGINSRNTQSCSRLPCEVTVNIDDNFYMIKLAPAADQYGFLSIAYNCRS